MIHIMPINIGWLVWFPIAFYFMSKVWSVTDNNSSVIYTSLLAASIKLIDLIAPVRIDYVINPAFSIIFEGMAVLITLKLLRKHKSVSYKIYPLVINTSWRLIYLAYALFLPPVFRDISPVSGLYPLIKFLAIENLATSLFVYLYVYLSNLYKAKTDKESYSYAFPPSLSIITLLIAIYIQITI